MSPDIIRLPETYMSLYETTHFGGEEIQASLDNNGKWGTCRHLLPSGAGELSPSRPQNGWRYFDTPEEAAAAMIEKAKQ